MDYFFGGVGENGDYVFGVTSKLLGNEFVSFGVCLHLRGWDELVFDV